MELVFDISQDEMPIFMAETEDHLQALDEILVRLEQEKNDQDLLQTVFRAAHTLKGMAGMIGHKRMVSVTHALETALDGLRKNKLEVDSALIDLCLEAVDGLRLLREEVIHNELSDVEVDSLTERFMVFIQTSQADTLSLNLAQPKQSLPTLKIQPESETTQTGNENGESYIIRAEIENNSVASAARAFQLMMAVQMFGEVKNMKPTQEAIESAAPVSHFEAELDSGFDLAALEKELSLISEVKNITISPKNGKPQIQEPKSTALPPNAGPDSEYKEPTQLGEHLVNMGIVSRQQLSQALQLQKTKDGQSLLLGQLLVQMGIVSQNKLDSAVVDLIKKQRESVAQSARKQRLEQRSDMMVRTSVERLDRLMNLVGELITDRNHLYQVRNRLDTNGHGNEYINQLSETVAHIGRITDQLQEEVMRIRMLPIGNVFHKFPRLVRDLSQNLNKKIDLVIEGEDTELDRSVIDEINDPLIHLIRNSVDHGIETPQERLAAGKPEKGTLRLTARHEQGRIIITVEDDGNGIDAKKIRDSAVAKGLITETEALNLSDEKTIDLIFLSGLSTSKKATDISGRGVGMDIVRANIQRINGTILVDTKLGQGTQFQIVLPLTLAIVPTLLVKVKNTSFAIPLVMVAETLRLEPKDIQTVRQQPVTRLRNQVLPLMYLSDVFKIEADKRTKNHHYVVVVHSGKSRIGVVVDALLGEEEVVVKSFGSLIGDIPGISSAAILGDGHVALIVDIVGLLKLSGIH
jgi:two-component system chemotaxis sensor kinase CheA